MVCDRCIMVVEAELTSLGFHPVTVLLGEAEVLEESVDTALYQQLKQNLQQMGFELLEDQENQLIEKIKTVIIDLIHKRDNVTSLKYSDYIVSHLHKDYNYLSKLFSQKEGLTIEHFIILQRIEKVKELIGYRELTLGEIAFKMGYSSVSALSSQFRKTTGITPSQYKIADDPFRITLDKVGK